MGKKGHAITQPPPPRRPDERKSAGVLDAESLRGRSDNAMEAAEEYRSPFDFEQGVDASYLYLAPAFGDTPPGSPAPPPCRGKRRDATTTLMIHN